MIFLCCSNYSMNCWQICWRRAPFATGQRWVQTAFIGVAWRNAAPTSEFCLQVIHAGKSVLFATKKSNMSVRCCKDENGTDSFFHNDERGWTPLVTILGCIPFLLWVIYSPFTSCTCFPLENRWLAEIVQAGLLGNSLVEMGGLIMF